VRIRPATAADLPVLQDIERAAGQVFRGIGMPEIADDDPVDGNLHIEQVSVHPACGRRGLGRARLDHAAG
jgi:ribosomal protein S18 acetylase RimI-like enzyme